MKSNKVLSIVAIIGLGIIVYANTFFCSFHFDDDSYIVNNFAIRNIQNLVDIWNVCPCRFITFLSIALNYHFHKLNLFGYHFFNMAVHLGSAILVWWLVLLTFSTPAMQEEKKRLGFDRPSLVALLAGLIFVSHPIQTEAVTYIWQRAASMSAFFYLASLSLYVKSRLLDIKHGTYSNSQNNELPLGPGIFCYILSLIAALVAMFTKENAITLPLMVLLYEICFFKSKKDQNWVQLFPFLMVLFIIPRTMMLTKSARFGEIQSIVGGPGGISPIHYLLTQFRVTITYIRLLLFPFNLNLDYDYPVFKSFFEIPVFTSFLSLTAILYLAKRLFSKYRLMSFSIFWFFLTLLPESSILPQADVIFEHRLYLPLVGYCMILASSVYYLPQKKALKTILIVLSLIIAFNAVLTYQRNKIWKNEIVLWEDIVQKSPHKARPYINRGWAYYNQGNFTQAMSDYNKAIEISPEYIYPYDDRGLIYAREGKFTQAIAEYNKAIKINPNYAKISYDRGVAFFAEHNYPQALSDYNKAIELNPEYVDAYNDRGRLYVSQGNFTQAIADYTKSIHIDPGQKDIYHQRSIIDDRYKGMI